MRYYLDTNILIFLIDSDKDNLHHEIRDILADYANTLLISSVVIQELLLLLKTEKVILKSKRKSEDTVFSMIEDLGITVSMFKENHLHTYASLQIASGHKDMNDHLIISQAICDKISLISSDAKMKQYIPQELKFVYNKR